MKVKRRLNNYLTKSLRKMRYRKGFGVHSPFAYSLITQVINEDTPFYAYEEILSLAKHYSTLPTKLPNFVYRRLPSTRLLFLLYRLINRFGSKQLLEVGNEGGLVSYVMGLPSTHAELTSIGNDALLMAQAEALFEGESGHKHCFRCGDIPTLLSEMPTDYHADFIYLHADATTNPDKIYPLLDRLTAEESILFIGSIHTNRDARRVWNLFCRSQRVRVSFDLYEVGICIIRPRFYKQHYIVSF